MKSMNYITANKNAKVFIRSFKMLAFIHNNPYHTTAEIAEAVGCSRATAYRFLHGLSEAKLIECRKHKRLYRYCTTYQLIELFNLIKDNDHD